MNELKINYRTSIKSYILPIFFSLGSCFLFAYKALNNVNKLRINKIFTLSEKSSSIALWILFGFSFVFLVLFIYALFKTIKNKNDSKGIIITDSSISVPKNGFSNKNTLIQFDRIINVYTENFNNNPCLVIESIDKKIVIYKKILSSKNDFDMIQKIISNRITMANRTNSPARN